MKAILVGLLLSNTMGCTAELEAKPLDNPEIKLVPDKHHTPTICSKEHLLASIKEKNKTASSIGHFACLHEHALAQVTFDCEGCVPALSYYLAQSNNSWQILGMAPSYDEGLCEESRALPFDKCASLVQAYTAGAK